MGRDYTIFAIIEGFVKFESKQGGRKYINVYSER
jgi:ribosomal protein L27